MTNLEKLSQEFSALANDATGLSIEGRALMLQGVEIGVLFEIASKMNLILESMKRQEMALQMWTTTTQAPPKVIPKNK